MDWRYSFIPYLTSVFDEVDWLTSSPGKESCYSKSGILLGKEILF